MADKAVAYLRRNTLGALALFMALGGTGYAATGGFSSGGALHACANGEGVIRLVKPGKKCKKGQTAVAWNQTGPKGAAGAKGATGAAGAPGTNGLEGPRGPSAGFEAYNDSAGNFGPAAVPGKVMGKLAVPAGNYMVTAKLIVGSDEGEAQCRLENNETADADYSDAALEPGRFTISLESTASFSTPGEWMVKCMAISGDSSISAQQLKIQAIQVASRSNVPG